MCFLKVDKEKKIRELEIEKLEFEIQDLKKRSRWYHLSPSYVAIILAVGSLVAGLLSGWFDTERLEVKNEIIQLNEERNKLILDKKNIQDSLKIYNLRINDLKRLSNHSLHLSDFILRNRNSLDEQKYEIEKIIDSITLYQRKIKY